MSVFEEYGTFKVARHISEWRKMMTSSDSIELNLVL